MFMLESPRECVEGILRRESHLSERLVSVAWGEAFQLQSGVATRRRSWDEGGKGQLSRAFVERVQDKARLYSKMYL